MDDKELDRICETYQVLARKEREVKQEQQP